MRANLYLTSNKMWTCSINDVYMSRIVMRRRRGVLKRGRPGRYSAGNPLIPQSLYTALALAWDGGWCALARFGAHWSAGKCHRKGMSLNICLIFIVLRIRYLLAMSFTIIIYARRHTTTSATYHLHFFIHFNYYRPTSFLPNYWNIFENIMPQ